MSKINLIAALQILLIVATDPRERQDCRRQLRALGAVA